MSKLDMFNKEYSLELLGNKIRYNKEYVAHDIYRLYIKKNEIELLEKYLTELQAIKNINPSDAMRKLDIIENELCDSYYFYQKYSKKFDNIKNYILKAQETEKELKELKVKYADILINNEFIKYTDNNENILNIIKQKRVDVKFLRHCETVEDYNSYCNEFESEKQLTQEEFNTLKEYLK